MAVATGPCPNCGSSIEFRAGSSLSLVCKYCKHVVVRTDRDMKNLGRVADVAFSDAALAPGDRGTFRGRSFSIEGRLVLQHPAGGTWEEYYAVFDGRNNAWISEAQGFWQVVTAANIPAPPLQSLQPQMQVPLGQHGIFVVGERNEGTFLSGEGELPFAAAPGTKRLFVDLSAAGGGWASIDYGDGTAAPQVYVGVQTSFAEFQVQQRGGDRPVAKIATQAIKCGNCGAPLPVLSPGAERAACVHCNAISDVKLQQVVARQGQAREKPSIELGRKGVLPVADARGVINAEWTVLGYVERSTGAAGADRSDEWFGWQEYLLYNVQHGYRWLVFDEGNFYFITPLAAGDIDASRAPTFVRRNNIHYRQRNAQQARVDFVLGEFYWKVEVGEIVWAEDYEHGRELISSEKNANEISWSHGVMVPVQVIVQAFGYQPKVSSYGEAPPAFSGFGGGRSASPGLVIAIVVIVILVFGMAACGACFDGGGSGSGSSSSSGGVRGVGGSSSGGFGGK
jgi:hypothetical protein